MLLTFSNSLENIHFLYTYKNIKKTNIIFKDLNDSQVNEDNYFLINNDNLIKEKKKLLYNKIFIWYSLNNKKINKNIKDKFSEFSKKNLLYKKNLLILKKNNYFTTLSIIKNKYINYLKSYKIYSSLDSIKNQTTETNVDENESKIPVGSLNINLNKYNLIKKTILKNKYLLWGVKKSVFESRRFIKKKTINNRLLGILKLKQLVETESTSTVKLLPVKQHINFDLHAASQLNFHDADQSKNLNTIAQKNDGILLESLELNNVSILKSEDNNNSLKINKNIDISSVSDDSFNSNILDKSLDREIKKYTQYENFKKFQKPEKLSFYSILYDLQEVEEEINRRREVFFNWKNNLENYYETKLGKEKFLSFQIKFVEKYGQYMRKYLFFKNTNEIIAYLKNLFKPVPKKPSVNDQKLNKIDLSGEWGVAVYTPEGQNNPGYHTTVFNYTNGTLLIREIKTKRFNKKNKHKYHNIFTYKAFTIIGPKKLVEISTYTQTQLKEEVSKLKTLSHHQTPEEREQLAHNLRVTFIKNFITFNQNPELKESNNIIETDENVDDSFDNNESNLLINDSKINDPKLLNSQDDSEYGDFQELHESSLSLKSFKFDELSHELQESNVNIVDSFVKIDKKIFNLDNLDLTNVKTLDSKIMKKILSDRNFTKKFLLNLKLTETLKKQVKASHFNFILNTQKSKFKFLYLKLHLLNLKNQVPQIIINDFYLNQEKSPFLNSLSNGLKSPKYKVNLPLLYEIKLNFLYNFNQNKKNEITNNFRSSLTIGKKHNLYSLTQIIEENRRLKFNYNYFNLKILLEDNYSKLKSDFQKSFKDTLDSENYKIEYFQDLIEKQKLYFFNFLLKKNKKNKLKKKNIKNYTLTQLNLKKNKYKNIKQLWVLFKSKIFISLYYNNNLTKTCLDKKPIISNYLWLNFKNYENYLLNFFFLQKKIINNDLLSKKKKTYFFNFRNKRLKTYRKARITHWTSFTHKSLNERRYQKFLDVFIKKPNNLFQYISVIFSFKFRLSYQFWSNVSIFYKQYYTNFKLNNNKIFQLPIHLDFWYLLKHYDFDKQVVDQKILLWQTKRLKTKKTFWMQQKKKVPKFLKKKIFNINGIVNSLQYDFITNYFAILKSFKTPTHTNLFIFKNKYLKLHGFKYSS